MNQIIKEKLYICVLIIGLFSLNNLYSQENELNKLLEKAYLLDSLGEDNEALELYTKIIELYPNSDSAFTRRSRTKTNLKDFEGATNDAHIALKINSNNSYAYFRLGYINFKQKDYNYAIMEYNKAIQKNSNVFFYYRERGNSKFELERYQDAIDDYSKAIEIEPKAIPVYKKRGEAKNEIKNYKGAIEDFNQAIKLNLQKNETEEINDLFSVRSSTIDSYLKDFYRLIENNQLQILKRNMNENEFISMDSIIIGKLLNKAAYENNITIIKYLIEDKKANVNFEDSDGSTPLVSGTKYFSFENNNDNIEIIKYLIEKGANVNAATGRYGQTALNSAIENKKLEIIKYLIEKGANVNAATGRYRKTALITAINIFSLGFEKDNENINLEVVKFLIEKGANVNDNSGSFYRIPLISAIENKKLDIVKYLIKKGADIKVKDEDGKTILDVANNTKNKQIINYIKSLIKK